MAKETIKMYPIVDTFSVRNTMIRLLLSIWLLLNYQSASAGQDPQKIVEGQQVSVEDPVTPPGEGDLWQFRRFGLGFTLQLSGYRINGIESTGPEEKEPLSAILAAFSAALPSGQWESHLDVLVKNLPLVDGKPFESTHELVRYLCEGKPVYGDEEIFGFRVCLGRINRFFYREMREKGKLVEIRYTSGPEISGAILCHHPQNARNEWNFDFISVIDGQVLQLKFCAQFASPTPFPQNVLSHIESIIHTFHRIDSGPILSTQEALFAAQKCLRGEEWEYNEFDLSKPAAVEETTATNQKAWQISYKKKKPGLSGRLLVDVSPNGRCHLSADADELAYQKRRIREAIAALNSHQYGANTSQATYIRIRSSQIPVLTKHIPPEPSEVAVKQELSQQIIVEVDEDTLGKITNARIISGHPLFHETVLKAVHQWVFEPYYPEDGEYPTHVRFVVKRAQSHFDLTARLHSRHYLTPGRPVSQAQIHCRPRRTVLPSPRIPCEYSP